MNGSQKRAWFNLIVITVSLTLTAAAVGVLAATVGMPATKAGFAFLGLLGLMGLEPILFRKKRSQPAVEFDERDLQIDKRAALGAFAGSYLFFVAACMATWFVVGFNGKVSVNLLPLIVVGGAVTSQIIRSIAILVQYGTKR
jgi:hypothetical protein